MAEQEGEDALLALEMAVNGRFGDANLCCDPLDCQMFAAVFENQGPGCIDDLLLSHLRVFPFFCHDPSPVKDAPVASRNAMDDTTAQDGINALRRSVKPSLSGSIADGDEKIKRNTILGAGPNIIPKSSMPA